MAPLQFLTLRVMTNKSITTKQLYQSHYNAMYSIADAIRVQVKLDHEYSVLGYIGVIIGILVFTLTIAATTWFLAITLTTTSDVTALYNCSAFFAYAFSIPLLGERLRTDKILAVVMSIIGVFIVTYADSGSEISDVSRQDGKRHTRLFGNVIIALGAVLYG